MENVRRAAGPDNVSRSARGASFDPLACRPADALVRALGGAGTRRRYRGGATLFSAGDRADRVLAIEEGWAKVAHTSAGGEQTLLGLRGPGDVIGELSALDGAPRSAGAVAVGAVVALEVPAEDFARALEDSAAARALIRILADRLRDADRKRIELTTLGTLGRVASRLLEIGERFGAETPDGLRVELPLSQEELATWCGSSREATVKALRQLRELGEITTGRRTVVVHDVAALRAHASVPA